MRAYIIIFAHPASEFPIMVSIVIITVFRMGIFNSTIKCDVLYNNAMKNEWLILNSGQHRTSI